MRSSTFLLAVVSLTGCGVHAAPPVKQELARADFMAMTRHPRTNTAEFKRALRKRLAKGQSYTYASEEGMEWFVNATIGGQNYPLILDTGSADIWVTNTTFACHDPTGVTNDVVAQSECNFGPLYDGVGFARIINESIILAYGDGRAVSGFMGKADVTIGGYTVNTHLGVMNNIEEFTGDGITSGFLGLGYPNFTSAYATANVSDHTAANHIQYDPFFISLYKSGKLGSNTFYTISLNRPPFPDTYLPDGYLTLGSLPPNSLVGQTGKWVTVPIALPPGGIQHTTPRFTPEAYYYKLPKRSCPTDPWIKLYTNITTQQPGIVPAIPDAGATLAYLPVNMSDTIAASYQPAAVWDTSNSWYNVSCTAQAPIVGIQVSGSILEIDAKDMINHDYENPGNCFGGITRSRQPQLILGDTFLKSVLVKVDQKLNTVAFRQRAPY